MSHGRQKCVVLVPAFDTIEPSCDDALRGLERMGYSVRRQRGHAQIDAARSQLATDALRDGFEELMWIDADIVFRPEDVDQLRSHGVSLVAGIYAKKGARAISCHLLPATTAIAFGPPSRTVQIRYAATGFFLTHRAVYDDVKRHLRLPVCNLLYNRPLIPFFQPLVKQEEWGEWYLGEDFSFCERALQAGHLCYADPAIRLWHVGRYAYGWEDAGGKIPRFPQYEFHVSDQTTQRP